MSHVSEACYRILRASYHLTMSLVSPILDARSKFYLEKLNSRSHQKIRQKIRAAFLVFEPETWDKQEPVYNEMKNRDNFDVDIIVVPNFNSTFGVRSSYGTELDFFRSVSTDAIAAYSEDGTLKDIAASGYDYIFYGDSYNNHMPWSLRSHQVIRFSKVCYVPYGFTGSSVFDPISDNREFFRNVYMTFFDVAEKAPKMKSSFLKTSNLGLQHFEYMGYPALEKYYLADKVVAPKDSDLVICWTPRWSYDAKIGGSHFLEFKDKFLHLAEKSPDSNFVLRPHPMMFCEFLNKGLMTESEVAAYKNQLDQLGIRLSTEESITEVLLDTDILISDYSSILMMYFLTGRPIVYCDSSIPFNDAYSKIRPGMYIAKSWNDVEGYIDCITNGNDYLKEKRESIIKTSFSDMKGSASRIVDRLIADYDRTASQES